MLTMARILPDRPPVSEFSAFIGNKGSTETVKSHETTSVQVVPSLSLNHSNSSSLYRVFCAYAEVGRVRGRGRNAECGRHEGIFRLAFPISQFYPWASMN